MLLLCSTPTVPKTRLLLLTDPIAKSSTSRFISSDSLHTLFLQNNYPVFCCQLPPLIIKYVTKVKRKTCFFFDRQSSTMVGGRSFSATASNHTMAVVAPPIGATVQSIGMSVLVSLLEVLWSVAIQNKWRMSIKRGSWLSEFHLE